MSASLRANMRGPQVKTPLLLLLLLTSLTGTAFCQDSHTGDDQTTQAPDNEPEADGDPDTPDTPDTSGTPDAELSPTDNVTPDAVEEGEENGSGDPSTEENPTSQDYKSVLSTPQIDEDDGFGLTTILIPVGLVVAIVGMIVCGIFIQRNRNKKVINQGMSKEDPYLEGSSTEKVPMPMFEEDVPSVLELEMEELDQWMKKDS
ncbi:transmembrane protein 154 isoform 2-T2 [Odontesthes bonariensis]|uniref:transmembrane protein 154 isoform X2 n=1 Tax=Odontesthes bonariensis TaxID=219752 RepID=UPI003F58C607